MKYLLLSIFVIIPTLSFSQLIQGRHAILESKVISNLIQTPSNKFPSNTAFINVFENKIVNIEISGYTAFTYKIKDYHINEKGNYVYTSCIELQSGLYTSIILEPDKELKNRWTLKIRRSDEYFDFFIFNME